MPARGARATGSHPALLSLARLIARAALREVLASEANSGELSAPEAAQRTVNHTAPEPQNLPQLATAVNAADAQEAGRKRGKRSRSTAKAVSGESGVIQRGKTR
jgi:hypothetical protein